MLDRLDFFLLFFLLGRLPFVKIQAVLANHRQLRGREHFVGISSKTLMAPDHTLLDMLQSKPPSHLLIPDFQFLRTRHQQIAYLVDVVGFLQSGIVLSLEDQIIRYLCAVLCFLG